MRRPLAVLAWLAVLVLLVLAWVRTPQSGRLRVDAQRFLAAPLDRGVAFSLDPGEETVKVVTWLTRPQPWARDVRATAPYRLDLAVRDRDGAVRWSTRLWHKSRASWIDGLGGRLLRPTWLPDSRDEVTDSRITLVDVAGLTDGGAELVLRATPSPRPGRAGDDGGAHVLAVAYRHSLRTPAARLRVLAAADREQADARAAPITLEGWDDLPDAWKGHLADRVWERLSPSPAVKGIALPSVELMHAPLQERWETQPSLGTPMVPGSAAALNLQAGARVVARWRDRAGRRADPAPTWIQRVGPDGTSTLQFAGVVDEIGPLVVDGPLESIQIALDPGTVGPRVLQVELIGDQADDTVWGDPPRAPVVRGDGVVARWRLAPDLRGVELVRLGGELGPARFPIEAADDALRISVRVPLPATGDGAVELPALGRRWDPQQNETHAVDPSPAARRTLAIRALDADGVELMAWEADVEAVPSAFERYTQGDSPGTARASEPTLRTVVPPAGARVLVIDADDAVDVGLRARHLGDPPARISPGYGLPAALAPPPAVVDPDLPEWQADGDDGAVSLHDARYVPAAQDAWRQRNPVDAEALLETGRIVRIDVQVRVESRERQIARTEAATPTLAASDGTVAARAGLELDPTLVALRARKPEHPLPLDGAYGIVAEPDLDGDTRVGGRTRVASPGSSTGLSRLPVPASGRLDVEYRVATDRVGQDATFRVDGTPITRTLASSAGRVRLSGLRPGSHAFSVDLPGLFLARADGTPRWQARKVTRLAPGERLRIPFPEGPGAVLLFAYGSQSGGTWLDWQLSLDSRRAPAGMGRRSTRQSGRHPLRAEGGEAEPLSFDAERLLRLRPLRVDVAEDAVGGRPVLTVTLSGTDQPVWLRALASWSTARSDAPSAAVIAPR
ncbi:MAG: hypothetical protein H6742_01320 [Alphaproteobacteria bacterium]|nr:hypothetical protein [Alphaproteobacteria bacterium]